MIRYADTHSILFRLQQLGHQFGRIQYKCIRPGNTALQKTEGRVTHTGCIGTQFAQIFTDKRELCMLGINIFNAAYFLNSLLVINVAADTIYSISRVDNNPTFFQYLSDLLEYTFLRIFRV
ncbi:hypothetical protein D3C80_1482340 [compost metagenome]